MVIQYYNPSILKYEKIKLPRLLPVRRKLRICIKSKSKLKKVSNISFFHNNPYKFSFKKSSDEICPLSRPASRLLERTEDAGSFYQSLSHGNRPMYRKSGRFYSFRRRYLQHFPALFRYTENSHQKNKRVDGQKHPFIRHRRLP